MAGEMVSDRTRARGRGGSANHGISADGKGLRNRLPNAATRTSN